MGRPAQQASTASDGGAERSSLRLVSLGGLAEVGLNCLVLEQAGRLLLIDCGVTFPAGDQGIDVYKPRLDYLRARAADLQGVVLTHGHEDHIGALPYLIDSGFESLPVWGPAYALGLCAARLSELGLAADLRPVCPGERFTAGPFEVEPLEVIHSTPQATALAIRTAAGLILHTGDFKLDSATLDADERRFRRLGEQGVRLLLSDSTNSLSPDESGFSRSERAVAGALDDLVAAAPGRVVVGLFASNVERLAALGEIAERHRRCLCLLGRSVRRHAELARSLGLLSWRGDLVVSPEVAARRDPHRVLYAAGGTQGEPHSVLRRLAQGELRELRPEPADRVILSSRVIPGNELAVLGLVNDLLGRGVEVISSATHPGVHASGHAQRSEQARIIEWTCPQTLMPVHGSRWQREHHAQLARSLGVSEVLLPENGELLELPGAGRAVKSVARVAVGRVALAGGQSLDPATLAERQRLGRDGLVLVFVAGPSTCKVVAPGVGLSREVLGRAQQAALDVLAARAGTATVDDDLCQAVRRRIKRATGRRPWVRVVTANS